MKLLFVISQFKAIPHLKLGSEEEWRKQAAALPQPFPTPRYAVSYIVDTFRIVKRKDEAKFNGEDRTKRTMCELYATLVASSQTSQPYQTRLEPSPADPPHCHPTKSENMKTEIFEALNFTGGRS